MRLLIQGGTLAQITPKYQFDTIADVVNAFLPVVYSLGGIIAAAFIIWAGVDWIISGGDTNKIGKAKEKLVAAIVGLVIMLLAFAVKNFFERVVS